MSEIKVVEESAVTQVVDVIVNAANPMLMSGGGICGEIFRRAGYVELNKACRTNKLPVDVGRAVIIPEFNITNDKYIIHAVGPDFSKTPDAFDKLYSAYYNSLILMREHGLHSIAFPLISAGIYAGNLQNPIANSIVYCKKAYEDFTREYVDYDIEVRICAFSEEEKRVARRRIRTKFGACQEVQ